MGRTGLCHRGLNRLGDNLIPPTLHFLSFGDPPPDPRLCSTPSPSLIFVLYDILIALVWYYFLSWIQKHDRVADLKVFFLPKGESENCAANGEGSGRFPQQQQHRCRSSDQRRRCRQQAVRIRHPSYLFSLYPFQFEEHNKIHNTS